MLVLVEAPESGKQNLEPVRLVTHDLDGVIVKAPIPGKTVLKLLTHTYSVPELGKRLKPYEPKPLLVDAIVARLVTPHDRRPLMVGAARGLRVFREVAERQSIQMIQGVLSGRDLPLHAITREWLYKNGLLGELLDEDSICLNTWRSSSLSKEISTYQAAGKFHSVTHCDDDLLAAQRVGQINGRIISTEYGQSNQANVLVYLIRNWSNNPWLLRWAGVELEDNVVPVRNLTEAAGDYEKRLENGLI